MPIKNPRDKLQKYGKMPNFQQGRSKQEIQDKWNNSTMTATTTGENRKPAKRTIEMYETALSGPPSKEWQEKKRKEESRKAAEAAAARAREEASKRGGRR
jgi:hypothetical protein